MRGLGDDPMMRSVPEWAQRARSKWLYRGQSRPPFAAVPEPGQQSVWDYQRPPRIESDVREVIVKVGTQEVARSKRTARLLETASPPTFYVPCDDVRTAFLERGGGSSSCEWKGEADYWSVIVPGRRIDKAAWSHANPLPGYELIRDYFSFYPALVTCSVDSIPVVAQPGQFYGGWVTPELVGPFKGEPGSEDW